MAILGTYTDEVGEVVVRYDATCRAEGCSRPVYGTSNGYAGYCCNHARLFYRNGEPLTVAEIRRRTLREAAISYADSPGPDTRRALILTASRCRNRDLSDYEPGLNFEMMLRTRPAARVCAAAMTWAEFDAEAPLAAYLVAEKDLYDQATCFQKRWSHLEWAGRQMAVAA